MYQHIGQNNTSKCQAIDIQFEDIIFNISTGYCGKKKNILKGVSGCFKSGELTTIMGPSGAGKSSLLNILTGFHKANIGGNIEYIKNGAKESAHIFRKGARYIQQEDQLHGLFTINESMLMATNLKIGNSLNKEEKEKLINDILETLDLFKVKESQCRYLSGGQKKRLSIALELIDNPPVMFLDEPTTGLDSSSTLQCITILRDLTRSGRTIICTIHQPSAGIYEMFDHIYLLAEGQCVYQGAPTNTVEFFKGIGLQCPKYHNPADYMIEVASKEYGDFNGQLAEIIRNPDERRRWRIRTFNKSLNHINNHCDVPITTKNETVKIIKHINKENSGMSHCVPSELTRFRILFNRCIVELFRDWTAIYLKIILHTSVGVLFGLFYVNAGSDGAKSVANIGFFMSMITYLTYSSLMPAVMKFPLELPVIKKERFNNWYQLRTYYTATFIANLPVQIIFTTLFCSVSYLMTSQPTDGNRTEMVILNGVLTALVAETLGLMIGALCTPVNGAFFGSILSCVMLIFTGFLVLFKDMPELMRYFSYISYARYSMVALMQTVYGYDRDKIPCSEDYCHYGSSQIIFNAFGIPKEQYWFYMSVLFTYLAVTKIIAYWALKRNLSKV